MAKRKGKVVLGHLLMAGAGVGALAAWRWQLRWGATIAEQRCVLPGDQLIPQPVLQATRAIGIDAPPREVWPWLVQIGADKAGFYSCDRLEPEWQNLAVGDLVKLAESVCLGVAESDDGRALVLSSALGARPGGPVRDFSFSWAFVLEPEGPAGTRLVARERYAWTKWRTGLAVKAANWISFATTRRILAGVRDRAERSWRDQVTAHLEDGGCGPSDAPKSGADRDLGAAAAGSLPETGQSA
ncbi:MAG: hypothetical protein LBD70_07435 [Bifidobacteriaceae bacterium]|jgi:hypothetical protein|nr:hypothetical protein [Bifidobacteriaceae bacterium]